MILYQMLATIRTVFNILAYILLAWVNRIVMTVSVTAVVFMHHDVETCFVVYTY